MNELAAYERATAALWERGVGRMVPGLERIERLATLLGDPHRAYPTVHVTGTNGKGSVVRMVSALCAASGMTTGTFTSPHLQTVRERIGVAGRPLSAARFAGLFEDVEVVARLVDGESDQRVTFFELLTAMALWGFADAPVDVGIFEVGMGGRWDATNVVRGDVAVINTVDVDHVQLGSSPLEVAREKVGIVKPASQVVSARQVPEVAALVRATCSDLGAELMELDADLAVVDRAVAVGGQLVSLRVGSRVVDDILLPVFGAHQAGNAALALGAFAALTGEAFEAIDDEVIRQGFGAVTIPGRLEVVHREPTVVLDAAHNPHGARASAAALDEAFGFRELVLVAACLTDKDVAGVLAAFASVASHVVVTAVDDPRAASADDMRRAALGVWGTTATIVEVADDLPAALRLAEGLVAPGDGILVTGSVVTVGAARDHYLPLPPHDPDEDAVVLEPADEPGPVTEDEADELAATLADERAFRQALDDVLDANEPDR